MIWSERVFRMTLYCTIDMSAVIAAIGSFAEWAITTSKERIFGGR